MSSSLTSSSVLPSMWAWVVPLRANTEHLFAVPERSNVVLFGLEIKRAEKQTEHISVQCYRCGKYLIVGFENMRVYNYCSSC